MRTLAFAAALSLMGTVPGAARAQAAPDASAVAAAAGLKAAGAGRLTWFGFDAYDARLWVAPGFDPARFDAAPVLLELTYLRAFRGSDIVERSLDEMRRAAPLTAEEAVRWGAALRRLLPDVQAGDRIAGLHQPGRGLAVFVNGAARGEVADAELARRFFGIWLGPTTSAPGLRAALLGSTS